MSTPNRIRPVATREDLVAIAPLIQAYQGFYLEGRSVSVDSILSHFSRLLENPKLGFQLAAFGPGDDKRPTGFCTVYVQLSSLSCRDYACMNDLYVSEEARGQGTGRALIEAAGREARRLGFSSLEWMTQAQNRGAQALYDSMGASSSRWLYYSLPLPAKAP